MSYQVLARKWRPQHFDEVAGQAHVTAPLRNAIRAERIPHAILLLLCVYRTSFISHYLY